MDSSTFFVIAEVAGVWEFRGGAGVLWGFYEFLWVNMSYYELI